jgi:hypothetical protein
MCGVSPSAPNRSLIKIRDASIGSLPDGALRSSRQIGDASIVPLLDGALIFFAPDLLEEATLAWVPHGQRQCFLHRVQSSSHSYVDEKKVDRSGFLPSS